MSVTLAVVGLALVLLGARVWYIQNENAEEYNKIVLSQRQSRYQSHTIPARRGDIYDRNGNRLAASEKVYILILEPKTMIDAEGRKNDGSKSKNVVEPTLRAVAEQFGLDYSELLETVENNPSSYYIRAARNVSYDRRQQFLDYQKEMNLSYESSENEQEKKNRIAGVTFEDNYKRTYPYGSLACSVLGFSNDEGNGGTGGVEQYYNDELTGTPGREYGYLDDDADLEKVIKSAENGNTLVLTIDESIQSAVEKYLKEWDEGEVGSDSAACIVMNPKNGEILAMASTNSFDLNSPLTTGNYTEEEIYSFGLKEAVSDYKRNHPEEEPITEEEVTAHYTGEEILALGKVNASYRIWRNICVSDTYEPGSTQKIFTVAGALEEGKISTADTFECSGKVHLDDGVNSWDINCVNRNGHGTLDVTGGITNSCNVAMMRIAEKEGSEIFMKYERIFGFGDYTGIDLPAEADTESLGFASESIGKTQLYTNSFGQNYNCTMIQMAAAYASVVNGGHYYQPHVVKRILTSDGTLVREVEPNLVRSTVSASTCEFLKSALFETVETGTGKAAQVEGYAVGGKTGTAQKLPRDAQTYVVSFCGFAPVEDPQLLCYVIVDEPHLPGEEAAHSSFASGIFSKIMAEALPAVGIYPAGTTAAEYVAPSAKQQEEETAEDRQDGISTESGSDGGPAGNREADSDIGESAEQKETAGNGSETDRQNETAGSVSEETVREPAPAAQKPQETDEFIGGEDNGNVLPEISFGKAPGEM